MLCATYLINRLPQQSINNNIPYFRLFAETPQLHHLKSFGCLCYVSTLQVHRSKLDPRATPHVFLGYSVHQKGYKVLCLQTHTLSVSRDVIFYEHHFPFHHNASKYSDNIYLPAMSTSAECDISSQPIITSSPYNIVVDSNSLSDISPSINADSIIDPSLIVDISTSRIVILFLLIMFL